MNAPRAHITTGKASLVGGIVVAIATMVLWIAATHELGFHGPIVLVAGLLVSVAAGAWTRLADL
jgi:ribose/xylose/arabinose/galactoside ABC-type transport system permease subunit